MILNFKVPNNLYSQINTYDLNKPKEEKAPAQPKVPTFPKAGIPEQLIPESVIPKTVLIPVINRMNTQYNDTYWYTTGSLAGTHGTVHYVISKKANKYWSAVWFDTSKTDIAFGYSYCLRNLKSYKNYRYGSFFSDIRLDESNFVSVKHNKKDYLYHTRLVTPSDIMNRKYDCVFPVYNERDGGQVFTQTLKAQLSKYMLIWNNKGIFDAYNTPLYSLLGVHRNITDHNWVPDVEYVLTKVSKSFAKKINIPFFRRKITAMCKDVIDSYNSPNFDRYKITFNTQSLTVLNWIDDMYGGNVPIDYLQQVWEELCLDTEHTRFRYFSTHRMLEQSKWVQDNVPLKSFVNMFIKDHSVFLDTVSMLRDVLARNPELKYTGRWRVQDFHDWAMGEQWKQTNKNESLPQDLFPTPVKVGTMTFIQPINTHQLAQWGRAARNCVGSSSYYNGIIKKTHFIILALDKNEPYLTIQARLEGELLKVVQIKKTCNASLSSLEEMQYQKAFQEALLTRSAELVEVS